MTALNPEESAQADSKIAAKRLVNLGNVPRQLRSFSPMMPPTSWALTLQLMGDILHE